MNNTSLSVGFRLIAVALVFLMASGPVSAQDELTNIDDKQTDKPAIVFMVAGQSNAKGAGVLSPAIHKEFGHDKAYSLVPGSTVQEVGLPNNSEDYTHSYIWAPDSKSFERIDPRKNTRVIRDAWNLAYHGMELPVVWELENRFPDNDISTIKWGVSNTALYNDWNPANTNNEYTTFISYYNNGMAQLKGAYAEIRVVGLYWDQGESDGIESKANEYERNLTNFFSTVRRDTGIPQLKIFVRIHIFNWTDIDKIIAAQLEVVPADPLSFLLDIDLGSFSANYAAWAFSPNNGHLSSKGFLELTKVLFDGPLNNATVDSFDVVTNSTGAAENGEN